MSLQTCIVCLGLSPKARSGTQTGVKFTSLRKVYDKAAEGCRDCRLLSTSFEAVVDAELAEQALSTSETWSSNDARVVCEYLDDEKKKTEFRFEWPPWKLRIELYGLDGERNPKNFVVAAHPKTSQSSKTEIAKRWIANCIEMHKVCGSGLESELPKRVLDIGRTKDLVYLEEPSKDIRGRYACQSYCWGTSRTVITDSSTYETHKAGVSIASLPKTFRDTITFARSLDLRYLWIDSMCIMQDSIDDWRAEAAQMSRYYSNAYVTLAATMSRNAEGGLFQPNDDVILNDGDQSWLVRANRHIQIANANNATLFGRGWIFQERLLSPRVIHFTTTELCFECNYHSICECGQDMPDQGWQVKQEYLNGPSWKTYKPTLGDTWHRMVEAYCRLRLTKASDKLPALSGLADQMLSRRNEATYLAGLWSDTLLSDLLWHCSSERKPAPKSLEWRAPSWSWVSAEDQVRYGDYPRLDVQYAKVIDVQCEYILPSITGEMTSGFLILEGPALKAVLRTGVGLYASHEERATMNGHFFPDYMLEGDLHDTIILRIGKDPRGGGNQYGLVLMQVDSTSIEYERLGLYQAPAATGPWSRDPWDWAETKTFKVI